MQITFPSFSAKQVGIVAGLLVLAAALAGPQVIRAQRSGPPPVAQVGPGSPLPVYVVNEPSPALPDGFVPGTTWKFTTWTVPSTLTFSARVERTSGGWAFLTLQSEAPAKTRWYYVPQMPGAWEQQ